MRILRRVETHGFVLVLLLFPLQQSSGPALTIADVGRFDFVAEEPASPEQAPDGFSGIAYLGEGRFLAVSDRHAYLYPLTVRIDPSTGGITAAKLETPLALRDEEGAPFPDAEAGGDREGIFHEPATDTVWIANERTGNDGTRPSIARHRLSDGQRLREIRVNSHPQLAVFTHIRFNRGFECLTGRPELNQAWTCNEQPLSVDTPWHEEGPGVVRLQKFDSRMTPTGQYAYVLDSRLADLLLLPDGTLLALETTLTQEENSTTYARSRIFALDFSGATNISGAEFAAGLGGKSFTPVARRLLFEKKQPAQGCTCNYEGITLGPRLANGDFSLILIADNGTGTRQSLYALRLSGLAD